MTDFTFTFPTRGHFGQGVAASDLKKELNGLGCRVMLCIGSGSVGSNGLYDEFKGVMEEASSTAAISYQPRLCLMRTSGV